MAYPVYDTYNQQQVGFPISRRASMYSQHPGDLIYDAPMAGGVYDPNYPQAGYPIYAPSRQVSQYNGRVYDEYDGHDAYYDDTAGSVAPWTPGLSRRRRHSSVSARSLGRGASMRMSSTVAVKFRRKGGFRSGITLGEAMASVRLSGNDSYTFHDLNVDSRGRIILKIRWPGYTSMTYEIPVDGYEGRVQLTTLARRIARACVHFLQANMVPISWDRVILYQLEETSIGVWQPVLSTS
ncbi:hypothetical protein BDW22DRAFT_533546 [Trametopsis cervina]|nr:hypothetical protein BDW22DRAFT_533546 [Trametopsis cervina]